MVQKELLEQQRLEKERAEQERLEQEKQEKARKKMEVRLVHFQCHPCCFTLPNNRSKSGW